jgi:hypothetical protein
VTSGRTEPVIGSARCAAQFTSSVSRVGKTIRSNRLLSANDGSRRILELATHILKGLLLFPFLEADQGEAFEMSGLKETQLHQDPYREPQIPCRHVETSLSRQTGSLTPVMRLCQAARVCRGHSQRRERQTSSRNLISSAGRLALVSARLLKRPYLRLDLLQT